MRELLSVFQGTPRGSPIAGAVLRPATPDEIAACDEICRQVHGHDRHCELHYWIDVGTARVVERGGRITGYATGFGYTGHAVGKTDDDVIALLAGADEFTGLGFLVPSRNTRLMAWCFDSGLKIVQQSTLIAIGLYNEPRGAWLPSIGYQSPRPKVAHLLHIRHRRNEPSLRLRPKLRVVRLLSEILHR